MNIVFQYLRTTGGGGRDVAVILIALVISRREFQPLKNAQL